jgi:hypothetical protein
MASGMMALEGARCALHPASIASGTCDRCGTFTCGSCETLHELKRYCPPCAKKMVQPLVRGSNLAYASVVLGIVGLHCLFPLGALGLVLAYVEQGRIDRGEAPEAGRGMLVSAKVCGFICAACTVMGVLLLSGLIFATAH